MNGIFKAYVRPGTRRTIVAFTLAAWAVASAAQATATTPPANAAPVAKWPDDARMATPEATRAHLADKVVRVQPKTGLAWRMDFRENGTVYLNSGAYRDTGRWRPDGNRLCMEWYGNSPSGCNEVRLGGGSMWLLRASGELLELVSER